MLVALMQQSIVEAAMAKENVLGIMPTGGGKSVCYQVPALSLYDKTGALTVVISPLVALMADQVDGLQKRGIDIHCCITINRLGYPCPSVLKPSPRCASVMPPSSSYRPSNFAASRFAACY